MIPSKLFQHQIKDPFFKLARLFRASKKVVDPADAEDLPVYTYELKSPHENIIYVWGLGETGALGHYLQKKKLMKSKSDARFRTFNRPLRLRFGEQHVVQHVAAGFGFTAFAINSTNHNKVFGTGINTDSQIGYHLNRKKVPLQILLAPAPIGMHFKNPKKTKVIGLSAGRAHLIINTDNEGVYSLGNNSYGQCGREVVENEKYSGSQVVYNIPKFTDEKIVNVECGQDHTFFLTENGSLYSCGWGADGQTGLGHYDCNGIPTKVEGDISGEKIIKVSSRSDCVLALNDKGEVFGWGNSEYCQIFKDTDNIQQINRPILVKKCQNFGKIIDIATAGSYCMMLNSDGEVFTWGYGLLGHGPQVSLSWEPKLIPPILFGRNEFQKDCKVISIYGGLNHSGAITNLGDVYMWGTNKGCCLGMGDDKPRYFPLRVSLSALAKKLSLGVDHTIAICRTFGLSHPKANRKKDEGTTKETPERF